MKNMAIKSQSAMEYLMTYGWAILAIAIVMVSLYSLGIFNAANLKPTANPGACTVVRTSAQVSLAGQCSNLIPKYVGQFAGTTSSYVSTGTAGLPLGTNQRSVFAWIYWTGTAGSTYFTVEGYGSGCSGPGLSSLGITPNNVLLFNTCGGSGATSNLAVNTKTWYFVGYTYSGGTVTIYLNGQSYTGSSSINTLSGSSYVGLRADNSYPFQGSIADVQIYNTSLDSTSAKALYLEGIGGAPIDVNHLVGWWPLNGNANDYSGNNNQGTPSSVIWNANWQSGYTSPST